jgi:hypothetical protein
VDHIIRALGQFHEEGAVLDRSFHHMAIQAGEILPPPRAEIVEDDYLGAISHP